jgi:hypothetical protein
MANLEAVRDRGKVAAKPRVVAVIEGPQRSTVDRKGRPKLPGVEISIGNLKRLATKEANRGRGIGEADGDNNGTTVFDTFGSQLMEYNRKFLNRRDLNDKTPDAPAPTMTPNGKSGQRQDDGGTGPGDEN